MSQTVLLSGSSMKHVLTDKVLFDRQKLHTPAFAFKMLNVLGAMFGGVSKHPVGENGAKTCTLRVSVMYGQHTVDICEQNWPLDCPLTALSARDMAIVDAIFFDVFEVQDEPFTAEDLAEHAADFAEEHNDAEMFTGVMGWSYHVLEPKKRGE